MVRAFFFAAGLYLVTCGISCLLIDKMVLNWRDFSGHAPGNRAYFTSVGEDRRFVFDPPDWMAFSLMTVGSLTTLYSVALPAPRRILDRI